MWGAARLAGAVVLLRIEDHDRQRSRAAFAEALVADLGWLGFVADEGPVRQSDDAAEHAFRAGLDALAAAGRVYRCGCTRSTFAAWARDHGRDWTGPGCPGACRTRVLPGDAATSVRVDLGDRMESFDDVLIGRQSGQVAAAGDLVVKDRSGNWTYPFAVVVDDLRQDVDLVVRGDDLVGDTPRQIRLARLLGRRETPLFLHHPLVLAEDGRKLSKSDGAAGIRELRAAGWSAERIRAEAARLGRVPRQIVEAARG